MRRSRNSKEGEEDVEEG